MSHSNSSLNCFANCQKKYWHKYINFSVPEVTWFPHLEFGTMAHEVLEKAGHLRDSCEAGISDYDVIIPSELYREDLKEHFGITNWHRYFICVCRQVAQYEKELIEEFVNKDELQIERELKLELTPQELVEYGIVHEGEFTQPLVGVIDLLLVTKTNATIIDYKFSTKKKTQDDFDMNSQLYLYALFVHLKYDIPLHNIKVGYIDIPKQEFAMPTILTNGTISRSKSQNCSKEMYVKVVKALNPDNWEELIAPGGYYHDIVNELALNKAAYLQTQYLDEEAYGYITNDLLNAAKMIEHMNKNKLPYLSKYDSYSCKSCEYLHSCKPWLNVR